MIKANKNFIIKNAEGFTSPEFNSDTFKVYVNVGSNVSPMGTFEVVGVVMERVETTINTQTVNEDTQEITITPEVTVSYNQTGIVFSVPNDIQNTPDLDIISEASNVTVALLEEWNAGVDFIIEL